MKVLNNGACALGTRVRFAPGSMLPGLPAIAGEYRFDDHGHV
nr:hypothetical protein [Sphingomonas melonis]